MNMVFTKKLDKISSIHIHFHEPDAMAFVEWQRIEEKKEESEMTSNQIAYMSMQENARHNKALEGETYRHNLQTEDLGKLNYTLAVAGLAETKRSNLVKENIAWGNLAVAQDSQRENARHNLATEKYWNSSLAENIRHNQATENLSSAQLYEASRHNKAMEGYYNSNLAESIRHNKVTESESIRHNKTGELLQGSANDIALANSWTQRLNQQEGARHNKVSEALGFTNTIVSFFNATIGSASNLARSIIGGR